MPIFIRVFYRDFNIISGLKSKPFSVFVFLSGCFGSAPALDNALKTAVYLYSIECFEHGYKQEKIKDTP
jgi:hypothetical protein